MSSNIRFVDLPECQDCEEGLNPNPATAPPNCTSPIHEDIAETYNPLEEVSKQPGCIRDRQAFLLMENETIFTINSNCINDACPSESQNTRQSTSCGDRVLLEYPATEITSEMLLILSHLCIEASKHLSSVKERIFARMEKFEIEVSREHSKAHAKQNLSIAREMEELELLKDMENELLRAREEIGARDSQIAILVQDLMLYKAQASSNVPLPMMQNISETENVFVHRGSVESKALQNASLARELEELELMKDMEMELVRARDEILQKDTEISCLKESIAGLEYRIFGQVYKGDCSPVHHDSPNEIGRKTNVSNDETLDHSYSLPCISMDRPGSVNEDLSFQDFDLSEDQTCRELCSKNDKSTIPAFNIEHFLENCYQNMLWKDDDYERVQGLIKERDCTIARLQAFIQSEGLKVSDFGSETQRINPETESQSTETLTSSRQLLDRLDLSQSLLLEKCCQTLEALEPTLESALLCLCDSLKFGHGKVEHTITKATQLEADDVRSDELAEAKFKIALLEQQSESWHSEVEYLQKETSDLKQKCLTSEQALNELRKTKQQLQYESTTRVAELQAQLQKAAEEQRCRGDADAIQGTNSVRIEVARRELFRMRKAMKLVITEMEELRTHQLSVEEGYEQAMLAARKENEILVIRDLEVRKSWDALLLERVKQDQALGHIRSAIQELIEEIVQVSQKIVEIQSSTEKSADVEVIYIKEMSKLKSESVLIEDALRQFEGKLLDAENKTLHLVRTLEDQTTALQSYVHDRECDEADLMLSLDNLQDVLNRACNLHANEKQSNVCHIETMQSMLNKYQDKVNTLTSAKKLCEETSANDSSNLQSGLSSGIETLALVQALLQSGIGLVAELCKSRNQSMKELSNNQKALAQCEKKNMVQHVKMEEILLTVESDLQTIEADLTHLTKQKKVSISEIALLNAALTDSNKTIHKQMEAAALAARRLQDERSEGTSREAALQACVDSLSADSAAKTLQLEQEQEEIGRRLAEAVHAVAGAQGLLVAGQARLAGLERSLADREQEVHGLQARLAELEECIAAGERALQEQCSRMEAAGQHTQDALAGAQTGLEGCRGRWATSRRLLEQQLADAQGWLRTWEGQVEGRCRELEAGLAEMEVGLARVGAEQEDALQRRAAMEADQSKAVKLLEEELAASKASLAAQQAAAEQAAALAARLLEEEKSSFILRETALRNDLEERLEYVDSFLRSQLSEQAVAFAAREAELLSALAAASQSAEKARADALSLTHCASARQTALVVERRECAAAIESLDARSAKIACSMQALETAAAQAEDRQATTAWALARRAEEVSATAALLEKREGEIAALAAAVQRAEAEVRSAEQRRDEATAAAERAELGADGRIGELLDEIAELQTGCRRVEALAAAEGKRAAAAEAATEAAKAARTAAESKAREAREAREAAAAAAAAAERAADARIGELLSEADGLRRRLAAAEERQRELEAHANELAENSR